MHIWINLTVLIIGVLLGIYIATYVAYEQLIDECRFQIVEQPEEEIAQEPIFESNNLNNHDGATASMFKHVFIVLIGYLSFYLLNRHLKIICNSYKLVNKVQNYTFESRKFLDYIDEVERENKINQTKWFNKMRDQQQRILKLRRRIKNIRLQKQLLATNVQNLLLKRKDTKRLISRRRSVQSIEIRNTESNISIPNYLNSPIESDKLCEQYSVGLADDILNQSNDTTMEVIPLQIDNQEETIERKSSFFQRIGTFSGSFFKTLNTNKTPL